FDLAHSPETLAAIVRDRFHNIRTDLSKYRAPDAVIQREQVTPQMAAIRKLPLEQRKVIYRDGRVLNQQEWYMGKARFNKRRAWQSHFILIVVEVLAVIAALLPIALTAFHFFPLNLQSLMANIAGGGAAWMTAKRYEDLNASYSVTANELRKVAADSERPQDEAAWGRFVENAEGSMSREHQLWRATRVDENVDNPPASAAAASAPQSPV
ncbi:MAG: SLATT domain-containing protein, partial [Chloroflexota bacterium]|nr:SLATT domain-containing protein [Chloroflexota bacterium]